MAALTRAVADAGDYEHQVHEIQARWRDAVGKVRSDSAVLRLIEAPPGAPLVTVQSAATLTDRSVRATNAAIAHLQRTGVLKQTTIGKRNHGFEATDLIEACTALERPLASPRRRHPHLPAGTHRPRPAALSPSGAGAPAAES